MAEPSPSPEYGGGSDRGSPPRAPRWVKVAAIVVGVLVLLFIVLQLLGVGGAHGPGRHSSGSQTAGHSVSDGRAAPPVVLG